MAFEQTIGDISQRLHRRVETLERSLEPTRDFLDGLANKLDWIKHIPSIALRTTLVLAVVGAITTRSNYVAYGNFDSTGQARENLKNPPVLIVNSNVALGNLSSEVPVGSPPNHDRLNAVSSVSVSNVESAGLSPALSAAIAKEFGTTQRIVSWDALINKLTTSDVVGCVGESHNKDQTQEIVNEREILQALHDKLPNRPIVLATERFTGAMQPQLEAMLKLPVSERLAFLESVIFELPDYKDLWGRNSPFYSKNNEQFENMIKWAIQQGFALIGLDNSMSNGTDAFSIRNPLWAKHTLDFLATHQDEKYLVVAIGGYEHMNNRDPQSYCPSLLQQAGLKTVTVGQSFEDDGLSSTPLTAGLVRDLGFGHFVVVQPEYAGLFVDANGNSHPRSNTTDYWIVK